MDIMPVQVTGEITTGAIGLMTTMVGIAVTWWVKNDRQNTKFNMIIENMQREIFTNRDNVTREMTDMKSEFRAASKSMDDIKLQLAGLLATQSMAAMFKDMPNQLSRAIGELGAHHYERTRDQQAR